VLAEESKRGGDMKLIKRMIELFIVCNYKIITIELALKKTNFFDIA